jgi:hypothetical protein
MHDGTIENGLKIIAFPMLKMWINWIGLSELDAFTFENHG